MDPYFFSLQFLLRAHYERAASGLREPELRAVGDMLIALANDDNL